MNDVPTTAPLLEFRKLHPNAELPFRAYGDSIGYDLAACLRAETGRSNSLLIPPRQTASVPTGLAFRAPPGCFILICSRSGLATNSIFVANAPGVIDPSYTGEIRVLLYNGGFSSWRVAHGERIAQLLVFAGGRAPDLREATEPWPQTDRGDKGFGSSGR